MRRFAAWRGFVLALAATVLLVWGAGSASAQGQFHGIAFTKGCAGPTNVGQPYNCAYQILNVVDQGQDTLQVTGLVDVVHSAGGDVNSGNILSALELVFSAPTVSCVGGSGAGTAASPYVGAASCTLPFGTNITTNNHSFYTVQAGDFGLPGNTLTDTATLNWNNTCTAPGVLNCTTAAQTASAGSSTVVGKLPSATTTLLDGVPIRFLSGVSPVTVFDVAVVTGVPGAPAPTGQVVFQFFTNGSCTPPTASEQTVAGPPWSSTPQTLTVAGLYSYRALYGGDVNYLPSQSECEPIRVLDANIQISPLTATNPVGTPHTLTVHVNINDGGGFRNASDGEVVNLSLTNAGGANAGFGSAGGPTTTTCTLGSPPSAPGSGDCQVTIVSSTAGTTTVHASTDVNAGAPFDLFIVHRETGDAFAGDSPDATKTWVGGGGLIAPTQTTCNDVLNGTADTLAQVNYSVNGGKIGQGINPGVFFFYSKITTTVPNQVVTVSQSNNSSNNAALFGILNGQAWLWSGDCSSKIVGTVTGPNGSGASFTVPTPGNYIIGVKYQTKSIAGTTAPVPADITYTFTTSLGGSTSASVLLKKQ